MNFLNEVTSEFPDAISFAPGRPLDACFNLREHLEAIGSYVLYRARRMGTDPEKVWQELGQYSRTNGIICELVAAHLARDEHIRVQPEDIIVTVGAQEAMAIVLAGLFEPGRDMLLVSDPSYIGITGLASIFGIETIPVPSADDGLDPYEVERVIVDSARRGRVRALYDIPDFNNPLGTSLPLERRRELLRVCTRHDVLVIEDNPYGEFAYDHERPPTLKSLDDHAQALYIGSFAKTLYPGLRVGYLVADQCVAPDSSSLAAVLSRVKSLLTVNTPPLLQAVVGAALLESGGTIEPFVAPKRARYKGQRDAMVGALARHFAGRRDVQWRCPAGGFFIPVTLPFEFGPAELRECALDYGVIVSPMRFFCLSAPRERQIRLSFSYVGPDEIETGVDRLARFVHDRVTRAS